MNLHKTDFNLIYDSFPWILCSEQNLAIRGPWIPYEADMDAKGTRRSFKMCFDRNLKLICQH